MKHLADYPVPVQEALAQLRKVLVLGDAYTERRVAAVLNELVNPSQPHTKKRSSTPARRATFEEFRADWCAHQGIEPSALVGVHFDKTMRLYQAFFIREALRQGFTVNFLARKLAMTEDRIKHLQQLT